VIVSRNLDYQVEGAIVVHTLQQAMRFCQHDEELFLIGGAQLYQEGLSLVSKLYITRVNLEVDGDAFLPKIDLSTWTLTEKKTTFQRVVFLTVI